MLAQKEGRSTDCNQGITPSVSHFRNSTTVTPARPSTLPPTVSSGILEPLLLTSCDFLMHTAAQSHNLVPQMALEGRCP